MAIDRTSAPKTFADMPKSQLLQWRYVFRSRSFADWVRERYGEAVGFNTPEQHAILFLTPEGAREVLSAPNDTYDAFWKDGFIGISGPNALWALDGQPHYRERKLLTPAFQPRNYRQIGSTIRAVTREKIAPWRPGLEIRALEHTLSISLDVIMRIVFGVTEGELMDEGRKILTTLLNRMHPSFFFFPQLQTGWFPLWRPYNRAKADFTDWVKAILAHTRKQESRSDTVLGRMLTTKYEDGSQISDEAIRDELITILLAGHETTATALAWALYELGRHPQVLAKLRAEVDEVGPEPDPDQVARLPYLSAVCNETLRFHTLLPEVARVLTKPLEFLGCRIEAGDAVVVSIMAIHHDPAIYPNPEQFNPERFVERTYTPFEFLPFGGGHRRCMGASLSDYEMRIALAEIISRWDFEPTHPEVDIRHDIAMGPKRGVRMRILERGQLSKK